MKSTPATYKRGLRGWGSVALVMSNSLDNQETIPAVPNHLKKLPTVPPQAPHEVCTVGYSRKTIPVRQLPKITLHLCF